MSKESSTVSTSKVIVVSSRPNTDNQNTDNQNTDSSADQTELKAKGAPANELVAVNRKVSLLEWVMLLTAPIINPPMGVAIIYAGFRYYQNRRKCDRDKATESKVLVLGLAQWAFRISTTVAVITGLIILLFKLGRFPGLDNSFERDV